MTYKFIPVFLNKIKYREGCCGRNGQNLAHTFGRMKRQQGKYLSEIRYNMRPNHVDVMVFHFYFGSRTRFWSPQTLSIRSGSKTNSIFKNNSTFRTLVSRKETFLGLKRGNEPLRLFGGYNILRFPGNTVCVELIPHRWQSTEKGSDCRLHFTQEQSADERR